MEYILVQINFSGNDDINFEGFVANEVESLKDWKDQIKEAIKEEMEEDGYMTIYSSDNDGTPFSSVKEVLETLSYTKLTKAEFDTLNKLFSGNHGHVPSFLDYISPQPVSKKKLK